MTREQEFWRDRLMALMGWGFAAFMLLCGWMISYGDQIEYFGSDDAQRHRAQAVTLLTPLIGVGWAGVAIWMHCRIGADATNATDSTVIPRGLLIGYAAAVVGLATVLAIWTGYT